MIKVFIENEAGSKIKNIFNEETLEFIKSKGVSVPYPYPYGFVLNTKAEDGDNADCFVITDKKLKTGDTIECEIVGLLEQFETFWDPEKSNLEEVDHNVLAVLSDENRVVDDQVKHKLTKFLSRVFSHLPTKKVRVGKFLNKEAAKSYINNSRIKKF